MYVTPGLPVVLRSPTSVQLGSTPATGALIEELSENEAKLLCELPLLSTSRQLKAKLAALCIDHCRWNLLLEMMCSAGVATKKGARAFGGTADEAWHRRLHPQIAWREKVQAAKVQIVGCNPVGVGLARILCAAEVGAIYLQDAQPIGGFDTELARAHAAFARRDDATAALLQGRSMTTISTRHCPDDVLSVGVFAYAPAPEWVATSLSRDRLHLPITCSEGGVEVGPLVQPGRTPCLHCVDLARRDADTAWPLIKNQLTHLFEPGIETVLAAQVAAFAAREILNALTTADSSLFRQSFLWTATDPVPLVRNWGPHPECRCKLK